MTTRIIEAFECTCDKCSYTWSSIKLPATCANKTCRSPRWNKPTIGSLAAPQEDLVLEKKSAASPDIESSYSDRAQLPLEHPEHPLNEEPWSARVPTDYIRHKMTGEEPSPAKKQTIEELKAQIAAIPAHKSVLPDYNKPPVVEDQPSFDELNVIDALS